MEQDLTILYLTVNRLPSKWVDFHMAHLLKATEGRPMIAISAKPIEQLQQRPATACLIQEGPFCAWNVYSQMLRGAKLAETKYVAIAEDDSLYSRKHFSEFRPPDDAMAYDLSRWSIFSWLGEKAFFSAIRKHGNFMSLGPRQLVIDALEEREKKWPHGLPYSGEIGRPDIERRIGVTRRKLVEWHCIDASVNLAHPEGLSPTFVDRKGLERKPGELKAIEVPYWGRAADIAAMYNETQ